MNTYAIKIERLTRDFKTVRALDGLSLEVPKGIVFGFLGPNGSGKTTTLRVLLGLLEPTEGAANVFGYDSRTHGHEIRKRTGALLEYTGLYERLSAVDNLEFYGRVWLMSAAERRDRIKELLERAGLWERRKERVGTWSRGMKQKLAVCRAILHRPSLLFLDEPTAGLDPIASAALRDEIAGLVSSEGLTVFLTTHNLTEAEKLCSMIGVINRDCSLLICGASAAETDCGLVYDLFLCFSIVCEVFFGGAVFSVYFFLGFHKRWRVVPAPEEAVALNVSVFAAHHHHYRAIEEELLF